MLYTLFGAGIARDTEDTISEEISKVIFDMLFIYTPKISYYSDLLMSVLLVAESEILILNNNDSADFKP